MTPDHSPSAEREQQALHWFTRRRADDLSPAEGQAFSAWAADAQNAAALAAVEQLWHSLELPARRVRKADQHRAKKTRWPMYAAAASLLLGAGLSWLLVPSLHTLGSDYATAAGERREVLLADGSRLRLDSASAVDIDLDGDTRSVRLRQGRVFAEVVHDGRPFVVHVDDARVQVLGTRFSVSRGQQDEVVLLSGSVEVSTASQRQRLSPGQRLTLHGEQLDAPQTVDAERLLAWRDGQLRVRDVPLQQVLQQLATYKGTRLVLLNEAAGQRRVSGSFNLDQADSAFDALVSSQKLRADALLGHWIIVR